MNIYCYPDFNFGNKGQGPIAKFFKKLQNVKPPELWVMVKRTLDEAKKQTNLGVYERNEMVMPLTYSKQKIHEFRIPKTRNEGVARLYFGYKKNDHGTIYILSAEVKKGKKKASPKQLELAEKRYKEVCK